MTKVKAIYSNKVIIALLIAALLFMTGQIIAPGFAAFSNIMNILSLSAFLGIIALGQTLVILSGAEGIDLSIGSIVSLSAVIASQMMNGNNGNMVAAVLAVLATGFILGIINGVGVSYLRIPPLIMTLAMSSVIQGIALIYTKGQPKGKGAPFLITLGSQRTMGIPNILFIWAAIIIIVMLVLKRTSWGFRLYGTGENNLTAQLSGIKTKTVRTLAYGASGCSSALGGLLILGYTATSYLDIGSSYVMPSVAAVVIGGVSLAGGNGSYTGTAVGAIVLTTLGSILVTLKMGEAGRQVVYGLVLLLLLIIYARQKKN